MSNLETLVLYADNAGIAGVELEFVGRSDLALRLAALFPEEEIQTGIEAPDCATSPQGAEASTPPLHGAERIVALPASGWPEGLILYALRWHSCPATCGLVSAIMRSIC